MTISSSLNSGVAGLQVNASRLATIADNIANAGTYGYKRAVADFHSLVIMQSDGSYSAGGVRASTARMIDQRGTLVTTGNPTDLAIGGRGMMAVTSEAALDGPGGNLPIRLLTTGPDGDVDLNRTIWFGPGKGIIREEKTRYRRDKLIFRETHELVELNRKTPKRD